MNGRILALLTLVGAAAGCVHESRTSAPPAPLVRTFGVAARAEGPLELRGRVAAQYRIRLGFKQPGVLAEVLVKEGDRLRKAQLVARLDDVDARAQWRMAVAQQEKAKRDAARAARLVQEGAMAAGLRDDAESQLEAAEAQVVQARDALERTRLLAPAAGTVFKRSAEPGETVGAGMPIVLLDTTGALVVKAEVTERELRMLQLGQGASLFDEDGAAMPPGRVTSLAATPSSADGLYPIEVTPQAPGRLRPGALLRLRFDVSSRATTLRIPLEALVHRQDRDYVFVLEGASRVRQVPIEVDEAEGREATVRSGLRGGERIVAEGAYFLQDGQSVRTLE